jgi:hypothetical protein
MRETCGTAQTITVPAPPRTRRNGGNGWPLRRAQIWHRAGSLHLDPASVTKGWGHPESEAAYEVASRRGSISRLISFCDCLPLHPTATPPVSAALVFAPNVVLTPSPTPIVWMNYNAGFRRVFIPILYMPTDVAATGYRCRTARRRQSQHASADRGAQDRFGQYAHDPSPLSRICDPPQTLQHWKKFPFRNSRLVDHCVTEPPTSSLTSQ